MVLLTFNSKYVVANQNVDTTTSVALVDDPDAHQTFVLGATQVVLAIYQANNVYGATMPINGMQNGINVDTVDHSASPDSPDDVNYPARNSVFWIGSLAAGSHTIKGRFCSPSGNQVTISNRILLIYIFNGDEFQYVDNATVATAPNATFVDDPNAQVTFTPSGACKMLVLYKVSNSQYLTEDSAGKKIAINIAGLDYGQVEKSCYAANYPDSVFTCHAVSRTAIPTTVKGRFADAGGPGAVIIDQRSLGVLLLADSTLMDVITSTVQVSTTSNALVNDAQALISRTTVDARELLVIAVGTKRDATGSSGEGECYGIKVDANDRTNSRGSPGTYNESDSAATAWAETLAAAAHTVQGRFSNNSLVTTAKIDARQVVALWFGGGAGAPSKPKGTIAAKARLANII